MRKKNEDVLSEYRIFETQEFLKRLKKMSSQDAEFVSRKLESFVYPQLKSEPFFGKNIKKLKGYEPGIWRYRIGKFRVFYMVNQDERVIPMLTIDDRKDDYK